MTPKENGELSAATITKREYLAAMAMQGYCADPETTSNVPQKAAFMADMMLEELAKDRP